MIWHGLLRMATHARDCPVQPTFIAIKTAFMPTTKFGYHFQCQPMAVTESLAHDTGDALLSAFARLIGVTAATIRSAPPEQAIEHRIFLPVANGGIGLADPVDDRLVAFTASFINTLPLLLSNPMLGPIIRDAPRWTTTKSRALHEFHTSITFFAKLIREDVVRRQKTEPASIVAKAIFEAVAEDGPIDVVRLSGAAHHHPQKILSHYFHAAKTSHHQAQHPWTVKARVGLNGSMCKSAHGLFNIYTITDGVKLSNDQTIYMLSHKLGIELSFLPIDPACHPTCKLAGPHNVTPTSKYWGIMRHAWHQASCGLFYSTTTRHDAWLTILQKYFRSHCRLLADQGYHLNKDLQGREIWQVHRPPGLIPNLARRQEPQHRLHLPLPLLIPL